MHRRTGLLLAACLAACTLSQPQAAKSTGPTSQPAPTNTTISACGKYSLKLRSIEPVAASRDTTAKVTLRFDAESRESGKLLSDDGALFLQHPKLLRALTADGRHLSGASHSLWPELRPSGITLYHLVLGPPSTKLTEIDLAVNVVKVKKWQTITFEKLGQDKSQHLSCGPFELVTSGDANEFTVFAAKFADHAAEHATFEKKIPLSFLNHAYAMDHVQVTDAAGNVLIHHSTFSTGGGSGGQWARNPGYRLVKEPDTSNPSTLKLKTERLEPQPIAYPVRVNIRLPEQFDEQTLQFKVRNF